MPRTGSGGCFLAADAEIAGDLRAMQEIGVIGVDFDIEQPDVDASVGELHRLKDRIWAAVRD